MIQSTNALQVSLLGPFAQFSSLTGLSTEYWKILIHPKGELPDKAHPVRTYKTYSDKSAAHLSVHISEDRSIPFEMINGYKIRFNGMWNMFQISHPEIGTCIAEFKEKIDAVDYCMKGGLCLPN